MSTNISRGPRVCPTCGQENRPTAARCWLCFTPLGGAFQTTPAPAQPELRLQPPASLEKAGVSTGQGVAILLAIICGLIGLATQGLGFWLFIVLAPVFVLLALPPLQMAPDGYSRTITGCTTGGVVVLVVASSIITFVDVCFPLGVVSFSQSFENPNPPISATYFMAAAWGGGLLAAAFVAWLIVRRSWPRGDRR